MPEPDPLALIQAELDGQLDPQQRAELARRLLADPEARAMREDLQRLRAMLDGLEKVEPPAELKASVLSALPIAAAPGRTLWPAARWRYAALIAGVLGAASLVYETVDGPGESGELAGTMAARRTLTLDRVVLGAGPVSGNVRLYRDAGGLGLAFELASSAPVDVVVVSSGHTLRVNGVVTAGSAGRIKKVALPAPGMGGRRAVDLTFLISGREVARATLTPPEGR